MRSFLRQLVRTQRPIDEVLQNLSLFMNINNNYETL